MKLTHAFLIFGLSTISALAQNPPAQQQKFQLLQSPQSPSATATNAPLDPKKTGYALGWMQGSDMKRRDLNVDFDSLLNGMRDALSDKKPEMTEQEARDILTKWQMERRTAMMEKRKQEDEKRKAEAPKNKEAGQAFLAKNAKEPGVVTLPDGLQYKVLKEGSGESPKPGDTVSALYRGTLINGEEFDSSAKHGGEPLKFPVGQGRVIKGWDEALQKMKPGAKWVLYIPSELAYGENGPPTIGPDQTLIFDIELVAVTPAPRPASTGPSGQGNQVVSGEIIKVPSQDELKKGAKIEVIHPDQKNK